MSRIINPKSAGKDRSRLSKAIVIAIRELAKQSEPTSVSRDLVAFIAIALSAISSGIDISVAAWEKRDYWVKADKFRMDWMWTGEIAARMKNAVLSDDWGAIARLLPQIAGKLGKIQVSDNHHFGRPWEGAYSKLRSDN